MTKTSAETLDPAQLARELEALGGVRRAFVETDPLRVHLVCEDDVEEPPDAAAWTLLARAGWTADDVAIEVSYPSSRRAARRVRFVDSRVEQEGVGRSRAIVTLAWEGREYPGVAMGGEGETVELRLASVATLEALEQVIDGAATFRLVGVKGFRAFDAELVAVLVRSAEFGDRSFVGIALAPGDPSRSAALAVLNATNRMMGNFLHVPE